MPKLRPGDVPLTPQEDAAVNAGIATDPDTFELDEAWFANAHPAIEVGPETVKRWRRSRGKKKAEDDVTVRIDADIAAYFRESGPGWQARLNDTLRQVIFNS